VFHSAAIPILAAYGTDESALDRGIRLVLEMRMQPLDA